MSSMNQTSIDFVDLLSGNNGRWAFTILGVSILLFTHQVPQRLWRTLTLTLSSPPKRSVINNGRKMAFDAEWATLDITDREIVKAIFFKGRMSDRNIMRMLVEKGLLFYEGAYSPIAHRVNFIKSDYVGYNSIIQEFRPFVEEQLLRGTDNRNDSNTKTEAPKQGTGWASVAPILEFKQEFHKRVEVHEGNRFIGHKTVYWVKVKRQLETPKTTLSCKLKHIEFIGTSMGQSVFPYPQHGDIVLHSEAPGLFHGIELSEEQPDQTFYVVSRLEGSENLRVEGYSPNDATIEFPCGGNKFRFRIGVEWSGRTYPLKEFLVWVTREGELKMEFERDL